MRMCACGEEDSAVIETRMMDGSVVRRRRECRHCHRRWNTYEVSLSDWNLLALCRASAQSPPGACALHRSENNGDRAIREPASREEDLWWMT
jgi:hypothetical protein